MSTETPPQSLTVDNVGPIPGSPGASTPPPVPLKHAGTLKPLTTSTASAHLDAIRGVAALMVLLQHARYLFFVDYGSLVKKGLVAKAVYFLAGMGHQAVMIFFVLSGYLITSSIVRAMRSGKWSWAWYAEQRLTRLYIVLIPAIALTAVWDNLGAHCFGMHTIYGAIHEYQALIKVPILHNGTALDAIGNVLFLQTIFLPKIGIVPTFGSNGPLWSLCCEFWYYIIFPLLVVAFSRRTRPLARVVCCIAAAGILLMVGKATSLLFVVWLMGAAIALLPPRRLSQAVGIVGTGFSGMIVLALLAYERVHTTYNVFLGDTILGLSIALFFYFILSSNRSGEGAHPTYAKAAAFVSGISYSLYLLHVPALVFLSAAIMRGGSRWQFDTKHLVLWLGIVCVVLIYTFAVWSVTEAKTRALRRWTSTLLPAGRTT